MKTLIATCFAMLMTMQLQAQFSIFGNVPAESKQTISLPDKPNRVDSLGRKQGEWAKKYANGRYRYTATFKDDRIVGTLTRFHDNGQPSAKLVYREGNDTCSAEMFDEKGHRIGCGNFVGDKKEGTWMVYSQHNVLLAREPYRHGLLHGTVLEYYENGNVSSEINYYNGIRHGAWIQYFPGGAIHLIATYDNDRLQGKYKVNGTNGKVCIQGTYKDGVSVGTWTAYDEERDDFLELRYDDNGRLTNQKEVDARMQQKLDKSEQNRKFLKDPEQYRQDPDGYMR